MELLSWVWWATTNVLGMALTVVWFLIGGWVSTLAQIGVVLIAIFGYKYGWRRAPLEIVGKARRVAGIGWGWVRRRERGHDAGGSEPVFVPSAVKVVRRGRPGDVNLSSLLNVAMLTGLMALCFVQAQ